MGHVFRAFDSRLETEVVIKVPTDQRLEDPEFHQRFLQESRMLSRLSHSRIIKILDVGEHNGVPYFVMPFLTGGNLQDRFRDASGHARPMSPESLRCWLRGMAEALDFMHAKGFIHRDIKPANILFDDQGHASLSDFGLSKLTAGPSDEANGMTAPNAVVGTPNYVAPELVLARETYDGGVDQYSLAVTVYEALAGRPPLEGGSPMATMVNQTTKHAKPLHEVNPQVPLALSSAVRQAMSKRPWKRFGSCIAFADAVLVSLEGAVDVPTSASSRSSATTYSTIVTERPRFSIAGTSRGKGGLIDCPRCGEQLVLKPRYAGQRGSCVHCAAKLMISADLCELQWIKPLELADSDCLSHASPPVTAESELVETPSAAQLFGIHFHNRRSLAVTLLMLAALLAGAVFAGRQSAAWTGAGAGLPAGQVDNAP